MTKVMSILLLLGIGALAHEAHGPESCYNVGDCPKATDCYTVQCVMDDSQGHCDYERMPVDECCITSEECCPFAADFQVGICDKNCTCQFTSSLQCTNDSSCENMLSATLCRQEGQCFYPYCVKGLCDCFDGTGADLDRDHVSCPDDCNDHDPDVSQSLVCVPDNDNDHFPDCYCSMRQRNHHGRKRDIFDDSNYDIAEDDSDYSDDEDDPLTWTSSSASDSWTRTSSSSDSYHDEECCMTFCVEPGHTCPDGWTDPADPNRFSKPRSHRSDTGVECTQEEEYVIPDDQCDCCDRDARVYPGSMYVSDELNNCRDADYNCNGETDRFACCSDGHADSYNNRERTIWDKSECLVLYDDCGGCSVDDNQPVLTPGWACEESCDSYGSRKRSLSFESSSSTSPSNDCPKSCDDCVCVDDITKPSIGECAKYVVACAEVRPSVYADVDQCCAVAIQ